MFTSKQVKRNLYFNNFYFIGKIYKRHGPWENEGILRNHVYSVYIYIKSIFSVSGKVSFPDGFWWPSWIYPVYESCPKLPSWQQRWICSRTPWSYH